MIPGRTDLRIGISGAKFDTEADFEVHLRLAPPNLAKNKISDQNFSSKNISGVEK